MKSLLICPDESIALRDLTSDRPLSALVLFGKPLITYWIDYLAALGAKEITILASDRPEQIRDIVSDGAAWGIKIEVRPDRHEATLQEARELYVLRPEEWLPSPYAVAQARSLPNRPEKNIDTDYETFFTAVRCWMPHAQKNRVGMKEIAPGIWASVRCQISSRAVLKAPCWIADNVRVEEGAHIGPMTVLEENVIVGQNARVAHSVVQPNTYVGEMTTVEDSIVRGTTLINWKTGSVVHIQDSFLLAQLQASRPQNYKSTFLGRMLALGLMIITSPLAGGHFLVAAIQHKPPLKKCHATRSDGQSEITYYELDHAGEYTRRWPQLWNIVCGEFSWFGNRPLSLQAASQLTDEFEKLWLQGPIGLFSQADAAGCWNSDSDEAKAHASFYATQRNWKVNGKILKGVLTRRPPRPMAQSVPNKNAIRRNVFTNEANAGEKILSSTLTPQPSASVYNQLSKSPRASQEY